MSGLGVIQKKIQNSSPFMFISCISNIRIVNISNSMYFNFFLNINRKVVGMSDTMIGGIFRVFYQKIVPFLSVRKPSFLHFITLHCNAQENSAMTVI